MSWLSDWASRNFTTRVGITNLIKEAALYTNPTVGITYDIASGITGADPIRNIYDPTKTANSDVPMGTYSKITQEQINKAMDYDAGLYNMPELSSKFTPSANQNIPQEAVDAWYEEGALDYNNNPSAILESEDIWKETEQIIKNKDTNPNPNPDPNTNNEDLNTEQGVLGWLQSLLEQGTESSQGDMPMEEDVSLENELTPIQMLAMKVKSLNPQAGQELWNMSSLPIEQIIELYSFRYDICLASNKKERRNSYYGMGLQKQKAFRNKAKKSLQSRYSKRYKNS